MRYIFNWLLFHCHANVSFPGLCASFPDRFLLFGGSRIRFSSLNLGQCCASLVVLVNLEKGVCHQTKARMDFLQLKDLSGELVIYFCQGHPNLRSKTAPIIGYIAQHEDVVSGPAQKCSCFEFHQ